MATRDQVVFLLNGVRHEVHRLVPPTRTLLDYLREDLRQAGTKEGCNEGDCGACTVLVREAGGKVMAVNSCIQFVPMLDGKSVTTVEGLRGPNGELHPVQRAMVECHGSQCGFCTPGFVMALAGLYQDSHEYSGGSAPIREHINDSLAGNLCRCTGYGPIVMAAEQMFAVPRPEWDVAQDTSSKQLTQGLAREPGLALEHPDGLFFAPTSLDELITLSARHPDAQILGGATDIGLWSNKQLRGLPKLISTAKVEELQQLLSGPNHLRIGAAVTYGVARCVLATYWPDLGELVRRIGSDQVRNAGTVGGNIANGSPIGDMPPALIALGSTLILNGPDGRRRLLLEDYFIAYGKQDRKPGEFVEAVEVPLTAPGDEHLACYKISKRFDQDISAVCGCFYLDVENGAVASARIAFGGMAAIPKRAKAVETALIGKPWIMATVEAALPAFEIDFQPISDMRASADYRLQVAKNLLVRHFHETTSDCPTRLVGRDNVTAALA